MYYKRRITGVVDKFEMLFLWCTHQLGIPLHLLLKSCCATGARAQEQHALIQKTGTSKICIGFRFQHCSQGCLDWYYWDLIWKALQINYQSKSACAPLVCSNCITDWCSACAPVTKQCIQWHLCTATIHRGGSADTIMSLVSVHVGAQNLIGTHLILAGKPVNCDYHGSAGNWPQVSLRASLQLQSNPDADSLAAVSLKFRGCC